MSRLPRYFVAGLPLHVVQRGNNRTITFRDADDFAFYRACLFHTSQRCGVRIHAYVLMTNHVHVLATPDDRSSMPAMMQSVGRVYVRYYNDRHARTGTLWEGRYRATLVDDETYVLACMRYIELNPVRAGIVRQPLSYAWSSHAANGYGKHDELVSQHALFRALGGSTALRRAAYRAMFDSDVPDDELHAIRDATQHGWALGDDVFRAEVTAAGRRAERLSRGRRVKARPAEIPL
jgi:putative transposase